LGLHEKLDRIENKKRRFTARRVTNVGTALGLSALHEIRDVSSRYLMPAFITDKRRQRQEQEEEARQGEFRRQTQIASDEKVEAARIQRRKTVQSELKARRRITQSAPTVQRFHSLKDSHHCQELSRRLEDRDNRNDAQRSEMERRRLAEEATEAKRLADAEIKRRREAVSYWSHQATSTRKEADAIPRKRDEIGRTVEGTPTLVDVLKKKPELLNHPEITMLQERTASRIECADLDNHFLPLFSTKQSYNEEVIL